jgi:hypothetical protein
VLLCRRRFFCGNAERQALIFEIRKVGSRHLGLRHRGSRWLGPISRRIYDSDHAQQQSAAQRRQQHLQYVTVAHVASLHQTRAHAET